MAENFANEYESTLDGGIDDTVTTLDVVSATGAPSANFRIRIDDEYMLVTGVASETFTVTRGVEGSTAASHSSGATVTHVLTAGGLLQALEEHRGYAVQNYTGTYDDDFDGTSLDAKWAAAGGPSVTFPPDGTANVTFSAQKARYMQTIDGSFPTNFTASMLMRNLSDVLGMTGILVVDASGNGVGFSVYSGNTYLWNITNYGYASTGNAVGTVPTSMEAFWLQLEKNGTSYRGRWSPDPAGLVNWSSWTSAGTYTNTMTEIGACRMYTSGGTITFRWDGFLVVPL